MKPSDGEWMEGRFKTVKFLDKYMVETLGRKQNMPEVWKSTE